MATDSVMLQNSSRLYNTGITHDFTINQNEHSYTIIHPGVFERENLRRKSKPSDLQTPQRIYLCFDSGAHSRNRYVLLTNRHVT